MHFTKKIIALRASQQPPRSEIPLLPYGSPRRDDSGIPRWSKALLPPDYSKIRTTRSPSETPCALADTNSHSPSPGGDSPGLRA